MNYFMGYKEDQDIVLEYINGITAAYSHRIVPLKHGKGARCKEISRDKVVVISGGGSGHEPAHLGYLGKNMLDVAIMGTIFEPPTARDIYHGIKETYNGNGTLLIIKNFEKDVSAFLQAEEMAKKEQLNVAHIIVDDDCSIDMGTFERRKRGVAGTILVHKIIGSGAQAGLNLTDLIELGHQTVEELKTLGVAFASSQTIGSKAKQYSLEENQMYFGIGIHGEPGYRIEEMKSSEHIALELTNKLISQYHRESLKELAIVVNGMGSTPMLDLGVFVNHVHQLLDIRDITVLFTMIGNYMTTYDTKGLSLSFLNLSDKDMMKWLTSPSDASAWNY